MKKSQKAILITAIFLLSTFGLSIQAAAKTKEDPSQDYYPFSGKWGSCEDIDHRKPLGVINGVFDNGCLYGTIMFDSNTFGILSAQYEDYRIQGTLHIISLRIINSRFETLKKPLDFIVDIGGNFHFYNPYRFIMHLDIDCYDYKNFRMIPQCIWIDGFSK